MPVGITVNDSSQLAVLKIWRSEAPWFTQHLSDPVYPVGHSKYCAYIIWIPIVHWLIISWWNLIYTVLISSLWSYPDQCILSTALSISDSIKTWCAVLANLYCSPFFQYRIPECFIFLTIPDLSEWVFIKISHYIFSIFIKTTWDNFTIPGNYRIKP